ncbi:TonB-dependent receptor [Zobellia uliginosa]|uniref:TonB-dependent receptor n=1 Tax=Zobellia uliginosa TaxID=143224 RepID=UPI0026E288E1|nr:TonB-dependent receptor [Zobellia uliginosa]MDO6518602.1 TonB-dependent receptor [Zobellia uliginosa]
MNNLIKNCIYTVLLFSGLCCYSQTGTITGKVTKSGGSPVEYANIALEGTQKGTVTDITGDYVLKGVAPGEYVLTASYISLVAAKKIIINSDETLKVDLVLDEDHLNLDEVVVSAGRTPEKLSEIPASITIVDSKQLKLLGTNTTNISEILEYAVPGLAPSTGTFSSWGQTLRGREPLIMVDGIPQSTPLRNGQVDIKSVQPNDISRIEVIKGSAAIYGNSGDGGIINYITKKPEKDKSFSGNSNLWGTLNLSNSEDALGWGAQQSFTGTLDNLSYYVSGSYEKTGNKYDGNGDPLSPTYGLDNTKIISTLGKVGYQINEAQTVDLMFNHYRTRQDSPFVPLLGSLEVYNAEGDHLVTPTIGVPPTAENPIPEEAEGSGITTTNVQLKYTLSDLFANTTKLETDVYYQKGKNIFFYDATYFENGGQTVVNTEKLGFRPILNTKLYLSLPVSMSLTYGLDILKDKTNQGLLDGRVWTPDIDLLSTAPFVQAQFKYKDEWVLKAGLRYDNMKATIEDFSTLPVSPTRDDNFIDPINVTGGDIKFSNTSANIGVRYIKHDEFIPYVNFSQGFSLPDTGRVVRGGSSTDVNNINPEAIETDNYEFGFLSKFEHIRFEAVGFYTKSNLGIGLTRVPDTDQYVQSKNPQKIYGAEFAVDFTYFEDRLRFGSSYSYFEGLTHGPDDDTNLSYIGGDVVSPPKTTVYVSIAPMNKLSASLRMVHVGDRKRFNTTQNDGTFSYAYKQVPVTGYTLVNISGTYKATDKLSFSLGINNLFNKFYLPPRSQWASSLGSYNSAGEGVNGRLSVNYTF